MCHQLVLRKWAAKSTIEAIPLPGNLWFFGKRKMTVAGTVESIKCFGISIIYGFCAGTWFALRRNLPQCSILKALKLREVIVLVFSKVMYCKCRYLSCFLTSSRFDGVCFRILLFRQFSSFRLPTETLGTNDLEGLALKTARPWTFQAGTPL